MQRAQSTIHNSFISSFINSVIMKSPILISTLVALLMTSVQLAAQPMALQATPDELVATTFRYTPPEIDLVHLQRKIAYPSWAAQTGIEGQMVLKVLVNEDGRILQCKIINSVHPEIDEQVVTILEKMKAVPALDRGEPIAAWAHLRVRFTLFP